jgi:hypothetical protein
VPVSGFLGHGHAHLLALHIGPRGVAGIHEHEIGVLPVGIVSGVEAGMVNVGGGNGIAASILVTACLACYVVPRHCLVACCLPFDCLLASLS